MSFVWVVCNTPFSSVSSCYFLLLCFLSFCSFSLVHYIFFFTFSFYLCSTYTSSQWFGRQLEGVTHPGVDPWRSLYHRHVAWGVSTDSGYALAQLHAENWRARNLSLLQLNDIEGMESGTDFPSKLQGCQLFPSKQRCLFRLQTAWRKEIILIDLLNQRECQSKQPVAFQNKNI